MADANAERFKALVVDRDAEKKQFVEVRELSLGDLMEGDVVVRVSHSTVNYKDGLAITGKLPVVRRWPMIPGIDFSRRGGLLRKPDFKPGDRGDPERLGRRRDALRRLREIRAGEERLADQEAAWAFALPTRWRSAPPAIRRCSASWRSSATASCPRAGRSS